MPFYMYTVDKDLRIISTNRDELDAAGGNRSKEVGELYFKCIPRLMVDGVDAVEKAIMADTSITLSSYPFNCFHTLLTFDVTIDPLKSDLGSVFGAQIAVQIEKECEYYQKCMQCQHLIDLGKTASVLSHGVRNPLNAIKGAVVYLKDKYGYEQELREFTEIMEEEIVRLEKFISSFLSTTFDDLEKQKVDLNRILKKIESFTALQVKSIPVTLSFQYGNVGSLRLNPFQVEHAILNVVNNALSVLKDGGHISVATRKELKLGGFYAVVEITDNGPGMPKEIIQSLSQPRVATASQSGKGFGLFLTQDAVQCHGGYLDITSQRGEGTTVTLAFPMESED